MRHILQSKALIWLLAFSLLGASASTALAQEGGTLTGRVDNGTADAPAPGAGLPVVLKAFRDGEELGPQSTTTDAEGRFRFDGLDQSPEVEYWPEVTYLDIAYGSQTAYTFAEGTAELDAALMIYEVSEDSAGLRADGMHLIVDQDQAAGALVITEIYLISNPGDRTVIGREGILDGQRVSVTIPVPEDAQDLFFPQMDSEHEVVEMGGMLLDTRPVRPGTDSLTIVFVYGLPMPGDRLRLERQVVYPTANVTVLVPDGQLDLQSDVLEFRDVRPFEGVNYRHYATHGVAPGTVLGLEIVEGTGSAASSLLASTSTQADSSQTTIRTLGLVLAVMALVFAIVYPLASRPHRRTRRS